jgi:hypothetical protein
MRVHIPSGSSLVYYHKPVNMTSFSAIAYAMPEIVSGHYDYPFRDERYRRCRYCGNCYTDGRQRCSDGCGANLG